MTQIAPLTPLRYDLSRLSGGLGKVVSPPYDVIDDRERAELQDRDPHNIVHLILPEGEGDKKYAHAADLLSLWQREGVLIRDDEPAFYRYDQTFRPPGEENRTITRRGFLALVKLVPFSARMVLPHERTLSGPKEDRLKLFRATKANLSPGFMLYRDPRRELDAPLETGRAIADFTTPDGIHHALAKVAAQDAIFAIMKGIANSSLLIADGHHRYETALRYSEEAKAAYPEVSRDAEPRYFMTFLVNGDDPNLVVFPTHRLVHSLPSFDQRNFLERAEATFEVTALERGSNAPAILLALREHSTRGPSVACATGDGQVMILTLRSGDWADHPTLGSKPPVLRRTDVAVLHAGILEGLLDISPEAQSKKLNLLYPQDAMAALADVRNGKGQVLFLMNATPVAQVRSVAEAGEVMPQKSTFFFPKVPTGLAVHTLLPNRRVPVFP